MSFSVKGAGIEARYTTSAPFIARPRPFYGIVAIHRHHDSETADLGVGNRPEGIQRASILLIHQS